MVSRRFWTNPWMKPSIWAWPTGGPQPQRSPLVPFEVPRGVALRARQSLVEPHGGTAVESLEVTSVGPLGPRGWSSPETMAFFTNKKKGCEKNILGADPNRKNADSFQQNEKLRILKSLSLTEIGIWWAKSGRSAMVGCDWAAVSQARMVNSQLEKLGHPLKIEILGDWDPWRYPGNQKL